MKKTFFATMLTFLLIIQAGFSQKNLILEAKDTKGNIHRIYSDQLEKPIVILFWATWCLPCKEELKQMKAIYKKFKDKADFYAIAVDDPRTVSKVNSYVRSQRLPYQILLDTDQQIIRKFGGNVPPFSIVINSGGETVYSHTGYKKGDEKKLYKILSDIIHSDKK